MARTRGTAALRRDPVPRHARRISGPVARPVAVPGRPRPSTPTVQAHSVGARLAGLPDHRLLDTLLRSRAWIWLLGIALGGIVFMQVSLLGMNAGIGRNVARSTQLEHENAVLKRQVAEGESFDRVSAAADRLGLLSPDAGGVGFLTVRGRVDARRAAGHMTPPSDTARATLASDGQSATAVLPAQTTTTTTTTTTAAAAVVPTAVATTVPTAAATTAPPTTYTAPAATAVAPTTADPSGGVAAPTQ